MRYTIFAKNPSGLQASLTNELRPSKRIKVEHDQQPTQAILTRSPTILSLPREVRDMIYREVFERFTISTSIELPLRAFVCHRHGRVKCGEDYLRSICQKCIQSRTEFWSIFMTCKQVANEARFSFLEHSVFKFYGRMSFLDAFHRLKIPGIPLLFPTDSNTRLNPFARMRSVNLSFSAAESEGCLDVGEKMRSAKLALRVLYVHCTSLTTLHINLATYSEIITDSGRQISIEGWFLTALRRFCYLKRLIVKHVAYSSTSGIRTRRMNHVFKALSVVLKNQKVQWESDGSPPPSRIEDIGSCDVGSALGTLQDLQAELVRKKQDDLAKGLAANYEN